MDKKKLFEVYEEIYATKFGFMPCIEECDGRCEKKPLSVLLPFEDEYVFKRSGKQICNEILELSGGSLKIIGGMCDYTDGIKCFIHEYRPISCRLYPFYLNLTVDGELELLGDETCPLTESLIKDSNYLPNMMLALNKLTLLIDKNYWKTLEEIPEHLWDNTCKERHVCKL
jgi:Fe-S-cluster containining protein